MDFSDTSQQNKPRARQFYRYVGAAEAYAVQTSRIIMTFSGIGRTWYTPTRYVTRSQAKQFLALPAIPSHRVGPYPEDELPHMAIPLRRVPPNFGEPGGGWEAATDEPAYLFEISPLSDV